MSILSRGCQLTHTHKRLYSFHQISMSCTNTTKYNAQVLDRNPSEKCSELIHSLCPTSMLWHQSQFLHANLMYRIPLPVHLLNVTLYTNFVHAVDEQADDNLYHHRAPWWHCVPLMQLLEQRTKLQCQVGAVTLAFYRSFFIQAVTGYKRAESSHLFLFFLITSQRSCNKCVHFDILTNGPHLCTTGTFMVLGRAFFVLDKYKNSMGIFAKFPLLRQLDQLRFFQLAISWSWITVGHLF